MARLDAAVAGAGIIARAGFATAESGVMAAGDTEIDAPASNRGSIGEEE
jgi:hypothetical protein